MLCLPFNVSAQNNNISPAGLPQAMVDEVDSYCSGIPYYITSNHPKKPRKKNDSAASQHIFYIINVDSIRYDSVDLDDLETLCYERLYAPVNTQLSELTPEIIEPWDGETILNDDLVIIPHPEINFIELPTINNNINRTNNYILLQESFNIGIAAKYENCTTCLAINSSGNVYPSDIVTLPKFTSYNRYR